MNDWSIWLNSSETRVVLNTLREATEELRDLITDGSHLQEKRVDSVALDYTYSIGQLDGMRQIINIIENIKEVLESDSLN